MGTSENLDYGINPGGVVLFWVTVVSLVLTVTVFSLRAYVKLFMTRQVTPDDWWMTAAVIIYIPYMIICAYGPAAGGTGRWTSELTPRGIETALWCWAVCEVIYPPMSFCIRTSVACFLLRLAVIPWHKRVIYGAMVGNLVVSLAYWIPLLVQCVPLSYFWQRHLGAEGYCLSKEVVPMSTLVHAVLGAVLDWVLAILPVAMLWSVRINRRTKIAVSTVLGLGVFCGITLIARIPFLKVIEISADFLHATTGIATVAILEPGLGIVAGSLVTLTPILKRFKLGFASKTKSQSSRSKHNNNNNQFYLGNGYSASIGAGGMMQGVAGNNNNSSAGGGGGGLGWGKLGSPIFMSWEDRELHDIHHHPEGHPGSPRRTPHRSLSVQLTTLFTNVARNTTSRPGPGEISGSEEELRRPGSEAKTTTGGGGSSSRASPNNHDDDQDIHKHERKHHPHHHHSSSYGVGCYSGISPEWEVEVSAGCSPAMMMASAAEEGRASPMTANGISEDEGGTVVATQLRSSPTGISVHRDIKVVSVHVDHSEEEGGPPPHGGKEGRRS